MWTYQREALKSFVALSKGKLKDKVDGLNLERSCTFGYADTCGCTHKCPLLKYVTACAYVWKK